MKTLRRMRAWVYRLFFRTNELLERAHLFMLALEAFLLWAAVRAVERYFMGAEGPKVPAAEEFPWHELVDSLLFGVLAIWLVADIAVRLRGLFRGYDFNVLGMRADHDAQAHALLKQVRKLAAEGVAGAPLKTTDDVKHEAQAIAEASAQAFSLGTFGAVDEEWSDPEARYLASWLGQLPESAWFLEHEKVRYCSVIIPVMHDSFAMVRDGHLNTVLAHIDRDAVAAFERGQLEPEQSIRFLIYTQVVLSEDQAHDPRTLVYCALQHLAFLLRRFARKGAQDAGPQPISLILETSSSASRALLAQLGFSRVPRPRASKREGHVVTLFERVFEPLVQRSPAGFPLFELRFERAESRKALMDVLGAFDTDVQPNVRRSA